MRLPAGWTYDMLTEEWWHEDCEVAYLDDMGGMGEEQRDRRGQLLAVLCLDCGECFDVARRPAGVAA